MYGPRHTTSGKNPGDVIETGANTGANHKAPYRNNNPYLNRLLRRHEAGHIFGENPGDIVQFSPEPRRLGAVSGNAGAVKVPGGKGWIGHPQGGMVRIIREGIHAGFLHQERTPVIFGRGGLTGKSTGR